MNGVHCQTSAAMTAGIGQLEIQSTAGPSSAPNSCQIQFSDAVEQAVVGVVERVLPQQRRGHRHHQERRDQQRADDAAAGELPVQQQGERRARAAG